MRGFECIKGVFIEQVPFDMERDLVTATLKKRRNKLLDCYKVNDLSYPLTNSVVHSGFYPIKTRACLVFDIKQVKIDELYRSLAVRR